MLEGRRLLIAAGGKPADLDIEGREHLITSEQFLELDALPPRILFVGGGYISFEFGHVAARAGAQVTIIHHGARPLDAFDPDLVDLLMARSRALGIDVRLGAAVTTIHKAGTGPARRDGQRVQASRCWSRSRRDASSAPTCSAPTRMT